jgi:hypothetical protein
MRIAQIRPQIQVARRAILMASLAFRASLEVTEHSRRAESCNRLLPWLESLGCRDEIDPLELDILLTPYGRLEPEQRRDAFWAGEGAGIYLWTLGKISDPPPRSTISDHHAIIKLVGVLHPEAQSLLQTPTLRGNNEIQAYFRQVASTRTEFQRRAIDEGAGNMLVQFRRERLGKIGLNISDEDLKSARASIDAMSIDEQKSAPGFYFVREHAISWLFNSRPMFFC